MNEYLNNLSIANYVEHGYAQVEPNHLSAQKTGQIYAQLPANAEMDVLEQGQFVKYDYATGECNFTGKGEWMLVFNEIKLYRNEPDCAFALRKGDYKARIYSPGGTNGEEKHSRYYGGIGEDGQPTERVTAEPDLFQFDYEEDPFKIFTNNGATDMPTGTTMVPRVFKTNIGDIYTTNCITAPVNDDDTIGEIRVGDLFEPVTNPPTDGAYKKGVLALRQGVVAEGETSDTRAADETIFATGETMRWQVVKVYTLPDRQRAVKLMRIA